MEFSKDNKKNTDLYTEKTHENKGKAGLNWKNWGSWRNWGTGNCWERRGVRGVRKLRRLRKAGSVVLALAMGITSVVGGASTNIVAKAAVIECSTDVEGDAYADVYEWTEDCVQVGGNGDTYEDAYEGTYKGAYGRYRTYKLVDIVGKLPKGVTITVLGEARIP